jgi:hypothetical protein
MQFIKKNYEKILLGLVLVGLVAAAVFLLFLVSNERQAQEERRVKIGARPVKSLPPVDLGQADALLKRAAMQVVLVLSDNNNRLFNPVRWQKSADGRIFKNPVGTDIQKLEITKITPLYLIIAFESASVSDSGARYVITIEQQAAAKANMRGKHAFYVSKGDKKEYGENKESFTLRDVQGPADNPTELILDLGDADKPVSISISKDKPFKRAEAYTADLKFPPENKTFLNRRVGDPIYSKILVAGEEYNIVAITENEVVLSAKSNQKKWTIKYNAAP